MAFTSQRSHSFQKPTPIYESFQRAAWVLEHPSISWWPGSELLKDPLARRQTPAAGISMTKQLLALEAVTAKAGDFGLCLVHQCRLPTFLITDRTGVVIRYRK